MDEFSKRVAVVTGAARGLGAAYARALAEQGAAVSVLDVLADQAKGVAEDIVSRGGRALAVETDVSDRNAFGAAVDATIKEFGQVDILINNAGVDPYRADGRHVPARSLRTVRQDAFHSTGCGSPGSGGDGPVPVFNRQRLCHRPGFHCGRGTYL